MKSPLGRNELGPYEMASHAAKIRFSIRAGNRVCKDAWGVKIRPYEITTNDEMGNPRQLCYTPYEYRCMASS